jgi:predicted nucleotidyltransferase
MSDAEYPGTAQHQAVLRAIVERYADDPRILAVAVFGSLGRGDWHPASDIDLDVVVGDGVETTVAEELGRLGPVFESVGERSALLIRYGSDAGDLVFESLLQLSVRYHRLADTNPNIASGLRVLGGKIGQEEVAAAAEANRATGAQRTAGEADGLPRTIDECLRYAVSAEAALQRERVWIAIEELHRMRGFFMGMFQHARRGVRPIHTLDAEATPEMHVLLGATLPTAATTDAVGICLGRALMLLDHHLTDFAGPGATLNDAQRAVLDRLRERRAAR